MSKRKEQVSMEGVPVLNGDAAGLDVGSEEIFACVPSERSEQTVRCFGTFTPDLKALAEWLVCCGIKTVALESTGVYWIPVFEVLEAYGLQICLVNARHIKNVPGRKSDVKDCQWIQRLHSCGLLNASFIPDSEIRALRSYLRHRQSLIEHRAAHIQHMHKALQQMNLQLNQVLSDITGVTGMQILRAIVAGEQNPLVLARFRNAKCASSQDEIAKALTGNYRNEHLFALKQALVLYDAYTEQILLCDKEIAAQYSLLKPSFSEGEIPPLEPLVKSSSHSKNQPDFDVRSQLYHLVGVDLTAVSGLSESTAQTILSEIGTDMSRWPDGKHFCSWLGLAPHNDISGGKILHSRILKARNRAGQALRLAAQSVSRSQTALGAYYRRMRARLGPKQAIVATAHKLARIVYAMLRKRTSFQEISMHEYEQTCQQRQLQHLQRKAAQMGFTLLPLANSLPVADST